MANTRKLPSDPSAALITALLAELVCVADARITVGYSGGLDSTVLLHLLQQCRSHLPFKLAAFHLHHGISPHADAWLAHCRDCCVRWDIPFSAEYVDVPAQSGSSLEAMARQARRTAFSKLDANIIALAHHRDDQVETVLYRLLRGTGVHGAAGMAAWSPLTNQQQLWRPLLDMPRSALLHYAHANQLAWIDDESNADTHYDRNFLRHHVIPAIMGRFSAAPTVIGRAARNFAEAATLLDELAVMDAGDLGNTLPLCRLLALNPARQRNLIRWFLARHDFVLSEAQLAELQQSMLASDADAAPCLRLGESEIRRFRGELYVVKRQTAPQPQALSRDGNLEGGNWHGTLIWSTHPFGISASIRANLTARPRQGGESLRPHPGRPRRELKYLFQQAGIPPWLRDNWPLLWHGDELVAIAGLAVAAEWQTTDGTGLWPDWRPI